MDLNALIEDTKKSLSPKEIDLEKSEKEDPKEDKVEFNLEDAVDDDFKKGFTDVDPFFVEIADKVNLNNNRLSKAVEGLINLSVAQAEVIKGMEDKINTLNDIVKAMSEAPVSRKAVLSKGEAEEKIAVDRFNKGEEPNIGLTESAPEKPQLVGHWRDKVSKCIRKGLKSGDIRDVQDIIRFQSIPVSNTMKGVLTTLSEDAEEYVLKAYPELEKL